MNLENIDKNQVSLYEANHNKNVENKNTECNKNINNDKLIRCLIDILSLMIENR